MRKSATICIVVTLGLVGCAIAAVSAQGIVRWVDTPPAMVETDIDSLAPWPAGVALVDTSRSLGGAPMMDDRRDYERAYIVCEIDGAPDKALEMVVDHMADRWSLATVLSDLRQTESWPRWRLISPEGEHAYIGLLDDYILDASWNYRDGTAPAHLGRHLETSGQTVVVVQIFAGG